MKTLITAILILGFMTTENWQFKADPTQSSITIFGTSSVHDWESDVKTFNVSGMMTDEAVKDLKVEVVVKSINSGKSIMDDKTYESLQASKYPKVVFSAANLTVNGNKVSGTGKLQLVGQTRDIPINAELITQTAGQAKVKGEVEIDMTKFGIDPPTAMFGTLETGEKVTIAYQLLLNK